MNQVEFKQESVAINYPELWVGNARLMRLRQILAEWWAANRVALVRATALVVIMRVLLTVVGFLAVSFFPENRIQLAVHLSPNFWTDMWVRWDATHYVALADEWYKATSKDLAFFPLLPFLIQRAAIFTEGDSINAGLLVAHFAYMIGLFYLYKLVELEFDAELAWRTVLYLAIAPMAFFFLSIYTEPLFLAFSAGAIYHARRGQWWAAATLGALACLTRPPGILLVVPLGYEFMRQWRAGQQRNPFVFVSLLGMPAALGGWMYYLYQLTGDPKAFFKVQSADPWHRSTDLPWHTLQDAIHNVQQLKFHSFAQAQNLVDLACAFLLIIAVLFGFRYLPRIYALYLAVSVLFLLTSRSDLQVLFSMPRFALVEFPAFILLAKLGRNSQVHQFIITASALLLGLYTALFVNWYWIA